MQTTDVLDAVNAVARQAGLDPLAVGSPIPLAEIDRVEQELGALLPTALRDFLTTHGRVVGWDVASTTPLSKLLAESRSLTETLRGAKRFSAAKHPFLAPLHADDAVAVVVGTTDAAAVGYSFVLAHRGRREESGYWFFWRDEYEFDRVADDFAGWLDSFLGYALAFERERA